jgi:hypothetical protein
MRLIVGHGTWLAISGIGIGLTTSSEITAAARRASIR